MKARTKHKVVMGTPWRSVCPKWDGFHAEVAGCQWPVAPRLAASQACPPLKPARQGHPCEFCGSLLPICHLLHVSRSSFNTLTLYNLNMFILKESLNNQCQWRSRASCINTGATNEHNQPQGRCPAEPVWPSRVPWASKEPFEGGNRCCRQVSTKLSLSR